MLSKRYESTEVERKTWLHVPQGKLWSTSSDTHQVVEVMYACQIYENISEYIWIYIKYLSSSQRLREWKRS